MDSEYLSPEDIEKAFNSLLKITLKAIEIIRKLDGKTDYIQIGNDLNLHKTIVSSVQKESYKLKLTKKIGRFYKKKPGVLKYAPRIKNNNFNYAEIKKKNIGKMKKKVFKKIKPSKKIDSVTIRVNEAQKMASAYQWLYVTENILRDLIRKVYGKIDTWWNANKVPKKIIDNVIKLKAQEKYDSTKRNDELEYTNLDQLKEIITKKSNWDDFIQYLEVNEVSKFRNKFEGALSPRNCIAHSAPLKDKDLRVVDIRFGDILDMIK